jgi:hypothetical protein
MIVRATRDLAQGTELTFWYHNPCGPSKPVLDKKLQHWGFTCDCAICLDAKKTQSTIISERRKLFSNIERAFKSFQSSNFFPEKKLIRLIDALETTYTSPAEDVPRLLLFDAQFALAFNYTQQNKTGKGLQWFHKGFTSLGFIVAGVDVSPTHFEVLKWGLVIDAMIEVFLHIRGVFMGLGMVVDSGRADEYARTVYRMVIGEDTSFEKTHG